VVSAGCWGVKGGGSTYLHAEITLIMEMTQYMGLKGSALADVSSVYLTWTAPDSTVAGVFWTNLIVS